VVSLCFSLSATSLRNSIITKKVSDGNKYYHIVSNTFCIFSGMEIAFISSNKIYLEIEKKQDNIVSKTLTKLTENPRNSLPQC